MAKLGAVQDRSTEEILASIRRMISEADGEGAGHRVGEARRPAGTVGVLSGDDDEEAEPMREPVDNVVALAVAQAMDDAEAEVLRAAAAAELEEELPGPPLESDFDSEFEAPSVAVIPEAASDGEPEPSVPHPPAIEAPSPREF